MIQKKKVEKFGKDANNFSSTEVAYEQVVDPPPDFGAGQGTDTPVVSPLFLPLFLPPFLPPSLSLSLFPSLSLYISTVVAK